MSVPFLTAVDLNKNELRQAVLQNLAVAPASPNPGQAYFDTVLDKPRIWNGSAWVDMVGADGTVTGVGGTAPIVSSGGTSPTISINPATTSNPGSMSASDKTKLDGIESGATADQTPAQILAALITVDGSGTNLDADLLDGQQGSYFQARANHTGSQLASTISDFAEAVSDQIGTMVAGNTESGITVTYQDADNTLDFTVTDSPTVGGATPAQLRDRATHTGTQSSATISDFNTAVDARAQAIVDALVGGAPGTLDTLNELAAALGDDPNFATTVTNGLNAKPDKYSANVGNGSATSIGVTHNLGTQDVVVMVRQAGTPFAQIFCDVEVTDANTVTLKFASAPALNAYRVVVIG